MTMQTYSTQAERIGKFKGEILGHAIATEVLTGACKQFDMPKNKSSTIVFGSWVPYGATIAAPNTWSITAEAHITAEGVTPDADTIERRDVTMVLNQYAVLYSLTDKDWDLYEDDIAQAMKEQTGERMGLVRELALYGKMKSCTNKFFAGGTSVATVDETVSSSFMSNIVRSLKANHGEMITKMLAASANENTTPVQAGFVAYVHTDLEYDIERLPNFHPVAEYGSQQPINEYELGTAGKIRFICSPELSPLLDSGATASGTGLKTSGTKVDVYPMIIMAKNAFGQVKLRGSDDLDPTYIPPGMKDNSDPLGQRGFVGAKFWHASEVLNPGWMVVGYVGATLL